MVEVVKISEKKSKNSFGFFNFKLQIDSFS